MVYKVAVIASLAAVASAQAGLGGLSSNCTNGLVSLATNPGISQCIAFSGLIGLASLGPDDSVVPVLEQWQEQLCAAPACDNSTVQSALTGLLTQCQSDFAGFGIDPSNSIVQKVVQESPGIIAAVKRLLCLRDTTQTNSASSSNGKCTAGVTFCGIELLNDVQTAAGQNLSLGYLTGLASGNGAQGLVQNVTKIPAAQLCTNCNRGLYQVLNSSLADLAQVNLDTVSISGTTLPTAVDGLCGANFAETSFTTGGNVTEQSSYCSNTTASARLRRALTKWA